jgi:chromosome segregation ATPase
MNIATISQFVAALAFVGTAYTIVDTMRKRRKEKLRGELGGDRIIVQSALELLEPYKRQVRELSAQLEETRAALRSANSQVMSLNNELTDARGELGALRQQVKNISNNLENP